MQLLDATLAMALTLAALATIVTILMEAGLRTARMRKKNLIEVMKLLNQEIDKGPLKLSPEQRWKFITGVVENPLKAVTGELQSRLDQKSWPARLLSSKDETKNSKNASEKTLLARLHSFIKNKFGKDQTKGSENASAKQASDTMSNDDLRRYLDQLGQDGTCNKGFTRKTISLLGQLFGDKKRANLYDNVSLEHVLRRLSEVDEVALTLSSMTSDVMKTELNRLARKYEEFGSAVSASFKRSSQAWSIYVGITFAVLVNVDGLRIFEVYQADNELATKVIDQDKTFRQNYDEAEVLKKKRVEAENEVNKAEKELKQAQDKKENTDEQKKALSDAEAALEKIISTEQIKQTTKKAQQQLADLVALGIPIGWTMYPNCPYGENESAWIKSDAACRELKKKGLDDYLQLDPVTSDLAKHMNSIKKRLNSKNPFARTMITALRDPQGFLRWLFAAIVTGVLIGLGAPFWFDVAKRLGQVRQGVRAIASSEERMSGKNANGSSEERKKIVESVMVDAVSESGRHRRLID